MGESEAATRRQFSRRDLLVNGGKGAVGLAALAAAGAGGWELAQGTTSPSQSSASTAPKGRFVTEPDLVPPHLQMTDAGVDDKDGFLLLTPSLVPGARGVNEKAALAEGKGQEGLMLLDARNQLVWFRPTPSLATNLQVQTYRGSPVLTHWVGQITNGIGAGEGYLLDGSYRQVAKISAPHGLKVDLHELTLTPQGTALVTAYRVRDADLSPIGGPRHGKVQDSMVLEIDVASGRTLFEWSSLDHVGVDETYAPPTKGDVPLDYFHVNSVALWDEKSLLVSARNTWALYRVDRRTGAVIWRMNGKRSDFSMGKGADYYWQHHARHLPDGTLTVFDDGAFPAEEKQSRGLFLAVDEARRTVRLKKAYTHPALLLTEFEGSVQLLANGRVFIGWGSEPYSSEFDPQGNLLLDARFPTNVQSYRAFRSPWKGTPEVPPKVVVDKDDVGGYAVNVSWNGATEVRHWQVLVGRTPSSLEPVFQLPKAGFETALTVHTKERYLAVAGLDQAGRRVGVSEPQRV